MHKLYREVHESNRQCKASLNLLAKGKVLRIYGRGILNQTIECHIAIDKGVISDTLYLDVHACNGNDNGKKQTISAQKL